MSNCGCGGTVAPVSYEYMGDTGAYVEGAIEGCVGEGCGQTIYESSDTVIESSDSSAVEAPADDKEA